MALPLVPPQWMGVMISAPDHGLDVGPALAPGRGWVDHAGQCRGRAMVGDIGTTRRREFTVLGDVVNMYEAATGSDRFDRPGSLTFVWKDGRIHSMNTPWPDKTDINVYMTAVERGLRDDLLAAVHAGGLIETVRLAQGAGLGILHEVRLRKRVVAPAVLGMGTGVTHPY